MQERQFRANSGSGLRPHARNTAWPNSRHSLQNSIADEPQMHTRPVVPPFHVTSFCRLRSGEITDLRGAMGCSRGEFVRTTSFLHGMGMIERCGVGGAQVASCAAPTVRPRLRVCASPAVWTETRLSRPIEGLKGLPRTRKSPFCPARRPTRVTPPPGSPCFRNGRAAAPSHPLGNGAAARHRGSLRCFGASGDAPVALGRVRA